VQAILVRIATSAALYLGAMLVEELMKELMTMDRDIKVQADRVGMRDVLPRALEVMRTSQK